MREQLNAAFPARSKASDGIMGDPAHRRRKSDHNAGNAIDVTHSPESGCDAYGLGEAFRRQMAANPGGRISYLIVNSLVADARSGWAWRRYSGTNPHRTHLHVSIKASARMVTRPWKLS
jgi:hypothetical protein